MVIGHRSSSNGSYRSSHSFNNRGSSYSGYWSSNLTLNIKIN